ncbi:MAG: hypothetical protein D6713_09005, partial [Deltaproteobacteria bacterium]
RGKTVVVTSHDIGSTLAHAQDVLLLKGGKVVSQGETGRALTEETIESAFGIRVSLVRAGESHTPVVVVKDR